MSGDVPCTRHGPRHCFFCEAHPAEGALRASKGFATPVSLQCLSEPRFARLRHVLAATQRIFCYVSILPSQLCTHEIAYQNRVNVYTS